MGHHAVLVIRAMRGRIDKADERVVGGNNEPHIIKAADAALRRNTSELAGVIASTYGASAGTSFEKVWTEYIAALVAYSDAKAANDTAKLAQATAKLKGYPTLVGYALDRLTDGKLPATAMTTMVSEHINRVTQATDAYATKEFAAAFASERAAYAAMFAFGKQFSAAVVSGTSGAVPADFANPPAQLRSGLARLLGEHAVLTFDVSRAVVGSKPAAEAAAGALNQNTQDILRALQAAVGPEAAKKFGRAWAAHIDPVLSFSVAVAEGNIQEQSRARGALDRAPADLGVLLAALSGGKVTEDLVGDAVEAHDEHLLRQITAFAARDFRTAHELSDAGYNHMFTMAETMATVVEAYVAANAPRGGADTGGGGYAAR